MALCLVSLFITLSSNAQPAVGGTVDPVTGNLITSNWQGTTPASGYGGYSGGYMPGYISGDKAIVFGYSQGTASQSIGIASALAGTGTGIEVKGYNYSWYYYNNDANSGNLSGTISLKGSAGNVLESYNYNMPQTGIGNWIPQSGTQMFTNQYQISQLSTLDVSFTGKDDRFWAGYYGPAIKAINVKLSYGVNPCATNPAYSPNCEGFSNVLTSSNLVPNPGAYAYGGYSIDQSYAINTALSSAGSGAMIHGFKWGYVANTNGPYCAFWLLACFDERYPAVNTHVSITNSAGATLYSVDRHYENSYNTTNYSYLFPSSQQMSTLGNFNFTATTNDQQAYIGSMWSRALYTVDPCVANPLYSPTCSGYGAAFAKTLQSSTTTTTSTAYVGTTSVTSASLVETSPAGVIDQTSPTTAPTASTSTSTSTASSSSSSTSASTATQDPSQPTATAQTDVAQPASTTPTPAGGPPATTTASSSSTSSSSQSSGSSKAGPSALAMSAVNQAKDREAATQKAAVQNAAKSLEASTQQSQSSSNMAISMVQDMSANSATAAAQFSSQSTQASIQASQMTQQGQQASAQASNMQSQSRTTQTVQQTQTMVQQQSLDTGASSVAMLKPPTQAIIDITPQASNGTGLSVRTNSFGFSVYSPLSSMNTQTSQQSAATTYQFKSDPKQFEVETPQPQVASFGGTGKPGNPLSEMMMQQRFELMQNNIEQQKSSVNRNVQTNEAAAGGVSLTAMAVVPVGFNTYSFIMKDAAFYEPKEVYKNQRTVDNVRLLRGLTGGSDAKHQEMVNSQYK